MIFTFEKNSRAYTFDSLDGIDIAIPVMFNQAQPNTYNVPLAKAEAFVEGSFVGDTRVGGSCNFEIISIIPHCNGTHTECVGHITDQRVYINDILNESHYTAILISVETSLALESKETYRPKFNENDLVISKSIIEEKIKALELNEFQYDALIIRTIPNENSKTTRAYDPVSTAFFTTEAIEYINQLGIEHLLVDLPSLDRTYDEGLLTNHHIFWGIEEGTHDCDEMNLSTKTITEMIFVPNIVKDGKYLLNLQIASFSSDASPSRPIIFALKEK
jgi:arylformamidase